MRVLRPGDFDVHDCRAPNCVEEAELGTRWCSHHRDSILAMRAWVLSQREQRFLNQKFKDGRVPCAGYSTSTGDRCRLPALPGERYCKSHQLLRCSNCKEWLAPDLFYESRRESKKGLECRECCRIRKRDERRTQARLREMYPDGIPKCAAVTVEKPRHPCRFNVEPGSRYCRVHRRLGVEDVAA